MLRKHILLISARVPRDRKYIMLFNLAVFIDVTIFTVLLITVFWWGCEGSFPSRLIFSSSRMNFDQLLVTVGGFGRYQKLLYVWICLPQIFLAFHMMASVFTGATPPHYCRGSRMDENWSLTFSNLSNVNMSISLLPGHADSCTVVSGKNRSSCETGWVYNHEIFHSTTVSEVNTG